MWNEAARLRRSAWLKSLRKEAAQQDKLISVSTPRCTDSITIDEGDSELLISWKSEKSFLTGTIDNPIILGKTNA